MKKIIALALAALMLLALCACGKDKGPVTYSFLEETLGDESYAVGFRLGDEELCKQINTALLALAENGKMAEIASNEDYAEIIDMLTLIDVPADTAA